MTEQAAGVTELETDQVEIEGAETDQIASAVYLAGGATEIVIEEAAEVNETELPLRKTTRPTRAKVKPRVTCEKCGRNLAASTRRHKCEPPAGFVSAVADTTESAIPERARNIIRETSSVRDTSPKRQSDVSLEDISNFLWSEVRERRRCRTENLQSKLF